jgi:hypothetical protein
MICDKIFVFSEKDLLLRRTEMKFSKSIFFLLFFSPSTLLFGDIINVPSDTSTIQGGIDQASGGDTVHSYQI